jgi:hypothetical protein
VCCCVVGCAPRRSCVCVFRFFVSE